MRKGRIGDAFCAVKAPAQSGGGLALMARAGAWAYAPGGGVRGGRRPTARGWRRKAMLLRLCGCDFMLIYAYITYCRRFAADYCICIIAFAFILCAAVVLPLHCRCIAVALQLRCRCIAVALPLYCRCAVCRIIYCGYPAHALLCPRCGAGNEAPQAAPWRRCPAL